MSGSLRSESETLKSPLLPVAAENLERTYIEVLGLCCSSEVALIENILKPLEGVKEVNVIVTSKTVIVIHDSLLISSIQIVNALNKARLEANVKVRGDAGDKKKWPSPYVIACGLLLSLSFLKYLYQPFQWVALGAVAVGIFPIIMRAFAAVGNFTLDVNVLMLLAVVGTIAMSDFLEAGTVVFLFTTAQWLESKASHKANAVMTSLLSLAPEKAVIAETGESVDVQDVKLGTILAVKAGEIIPLDGLVVEGNAEVDEKLLTGESFPVNKEKDSSVLAGAILLNGYISVMTTALAENCVVARMAKLVEEAQNRKSTAQRLMDTFSKYYTPIIVLLSACIAAIPAALGFPNQSYWFHLALVVLVSACPCGLILSTPVATFCAMSKAATIGLLFKGGDYLEVLAKTKVVAFDKTGTITKGELLLTDFSSLSNDVSINKLLYWVSSIESKSSHLIAAAVADYAESLSIRPKPENVQEFKSFPGEGVCGTIDGNEIYIGNKKLGERAGCVTSIDMKDSGRDGRSSGYIYSGGAMIGSFRLSDICRISAIDAVNDLNLMGIRTAMLTGDSHAAAMHAQNELKQAVATVYAELLPEEKAKIIHEFKKIGATVMVGDGVNDAPALATANIGIAMGVSGSALALETGHVILMSNDICKIPKAVQLAKKTRTKVIENLFFSVAVKAAVIALALAGHPIIWVAVLADVLTCLLVICNSMLLLRGSYNYGLKQMCQRSPIPGHSVNKCANIKTECKSSKCASAKRARSSVPVKCKDATEQCIGVDKQHKPCCSQKVCEAELQSPSQDGHSNNKRASLKTECKSSKCASVKCARSSEPVKYKDATEQCIGVDKQRKLCCSQKVCEAELQFPSQDGHSNNKCASLKTECKSSKCASVKFAMPSEPVKCKDATEQCQGGDKQRKPCCSQKICEAELESSSQEPAKICQGIPDDSNSPGNEINPVVQHLEQDSCKTVTCNENSCCVNDVVCCEDISERQDYCQVDEHIAESRCCDHVNYKAVDHDMESGGMQGHFKQLDDLSTSANPMDMHQHQHELKYCGNEGETRHEIESEYTPAPTSARGIRDHRNSSECQAHCSSICHRVEDLHLASQGHATAKHACISVGSRGNGACCSRSFRKECCARRKYSTACGCLAEIVIE